MKTLSKVALLSLLQQTNHTEITETVMQHWYLMYGRNIEKEPENVKNSQSEFYGQSRASSEETNSSI